MSDPLRVFSTLALKGAIQALAGRYQAAGGAPIDADFAPTLALLGRLRAGEAADVVILTVRDWTRSHARGASSPKVAWIWHVPLSASP
jgi:ABC-type molybdate transport system substrate-binding protein